MSKSAVALENSNIQPTDFDQENNKVDCKICREDKLFDLKPIWVPCVRSDEIYIPWLCVVSGGCWPLIL